MLADELRTVENDEWFDLAQSSLDDLQLLLDEDGQILNTHGGVTK